MPTSDSVLSLEMIREISAFLLPGKGQRLLDASAAFPNVSEEKIFEFFELKCALGHARREEHRGEVYYFKQVHSWE